MYRLSFRIHHKGCSETKLSTKFPKHHITATDIQSRSVGKKQFFYHITGSEKDFDGIVQYLKKSRTYKQVKELEREKGTLVLLVILNQQGYVQNVIQRYKGFFLDLHTVFGGYEYFDVGTIDRKHMREMHAEIEKMGNMKVLYMGKIEFANCLLSVQQKKIFSFAFENGYYEQPRKMTITRIAQALKISRATVGEHLLKAENKIINVMAKKI
jgi:predicted DNA binding protein